MNQLLVDSCVLIDFIRRPDKNKSIFVNFIKQSYALKSSIITHTELYSGKSVWQNKQALVEIETLFSQIDIIPLTLSVSIEAGKIRSKYRLELIDSIIAATAKIENLPLLTLNQRHFSKITGLKLL